MFAPRAQVVASYPSSEGAKTVGQMVALSGVSQKVEHHEVWDFAFVSGASKLAFGKVFHWDEAEGEKPGAWLSEKLGSKWLQEVSFAYDGMSERTAVSMLHLLDLETGVVDNLGTFGGTEFFEAEKTLHTTAQPMLPEFCDDMSDGEAERLARAESWRSSVFHAEWPNGPSSRRAQVRNA